MYNYIKCIKTCQFTDPQLTVEVDSFSDKLEEHRLAWPGGNEADNPVIYAIDGNVSTCIFLSGWFGEALVVDLGFHVNTTLQGTGLLDGVYNS